MSKKQIDALVEIFRKGNFLYALKMCKDLIKEYKNEPFLYNLKGMTEIKLNEFENSVSSFENAIKIKPQYVEAYNNLATTFINLGKFEDAIKYLRKAINLKPDYANAYNNLASAQSDLGNYNDAINSFNVLLKIQPNYPGVKENIIKILTFFKPKNSDLNIYTSLNNTIQKLSINKQINEEGIINVYKKMHNIVSDHLNDLNFNFSQIWRRNKIDLNCSRHFDVFRNFNVIPEFCFSCFKVQIELKNLVDLFKLYFLFDNISFTNNKSRKCFVELRKIGRGNYKGLIYCSSFVEANQIKQLIYDFAEKSLKDNIIINLKRGCTEFGNAYPEYNNLEKTEDKFMKYKKEWKDKEDIVDRKLPKKNRINQRILNNSIGGFTLNDFLIMKNWVMYAKKIGDMDYAKFDKDIKISNYIHEELSDQLNFRKGELKKNF